MELSNAVKAKRTSSSSRSLTMSFSLIVCPATCQPVCVCLCGGVWCTLRWQLQNSAHGTSMSEQWRCVSVLTPQMTRWISRAASRCYPLLCKWQQVVDSTFCVKCVVLVCIFNYQHVTILTV